MKLYYYERPDKIINFGDHLNPWLWNQLLPGIFDDDETTAFVGIGTLLNNLLLERLPKAGKIAIFGSGAGYETSEIGLDNNSFKVYCVRGLLSARKLGIPDELAVGDGAILIRRVYKPTEHKVNQFAYMPHIHHALYGGETVWNSICEQIGFKYIAPYWPLEQVLSAISQTKVLLAEAMHGAIIADALRVPWIPVRTSARILTFKWLDWCSAINVEYQPNYIMPLLNLYPPIAHGGGRLSNPVTEHWLNFLKQDKLRSLVKIGGDQQQLMATQLDRIAKTVSPNLSDDDCIEQLTVELETKLHQFKADVLSGKFS